MAIKSIYYKQPKINPAVKTAIIYSVEHLFVYLVEIKENNKSYYISVNNEPMKFGNMKEAKRAALKEGATEAYMALSKADEENDFSTCHANHQDRYDYTPVPLTSR